MNIHWDVEQGSEDWHIARSQFVSASNFGEIFTPTGKAATGQKVENFANKMIAQRIMGKPTEPGFNSPAMDRGHEVEPLARSFYELASGNTVSECGLVSNGDTSCSPDGLIMDGDRIVKGLEIKAPLAHTQIAYLLKGLLPTTYVPQLQGSMLVCEVEEWDFLAFHPDLKPLLITVKRDDAWIKAFESVLRPFMNRIAAGIEAVAPKSQQAASSSAAKLVIEV